MGQYALVIVVSYLLGSIPSGLVLGKLRGLDVRRYGSGNIGSTNVLRTVGIREGVVVLVADVLKGVVAVVMGRYIIGTPAGEMAGGLAAVAGHDWSIYIKFQGGRGVATAAGALIVMSPAVAGASICIFIVVVALTRYVSLGSMTAAVGAVATMGALTALDREPVEYLIYIGIAAALIIFQHRDNIARLLSGTESKLGDDQGRRRIK
jgi:glycerol-3-phosphate acyltransferase PlsY